LKKSLEINPALEEGKEEDKKESEEEEFENNYEEDLAYEDKDVNLEDYLNDDYGGYKMQGDGNYSPDEEEREIPISGGVSLHEQLIAQLGFLKLDERQKMIGRAT
jgi:RNA polymerase sigma-54 factor